MNILLVVNNNRDKDYHFSSEVIDFLNSKGISLYSDNEEVIDRFNLLNIRKELLNIIDFALIIGGDGTILEYASNYGQCEFPCVGINLGRVGALALLEVDNYKEYLEKIINKEYYVVEQLGLNVVIKFNETKEEVSHIAYNDVILHRGLSLKLMPILIGVNDSKKEIIYADGVIVATPVGSSAYSASCGGPLLAKSSESYVITPICPQSKCFVSLVVSDKEKTYLSISKKEKNFEKESIISVDGIYKYFVSNNDEIIINKTIKGLKMIQMHNNESLYSSIHKAVLSIGKGEG